MILSSYRLSFNLYLSDPARKAFVTGLSWDTTSILKSSLFLSIFTVFLLYLVLYFFLGQDLCYSDTIVQCWWRFLQGLDSQYFKGFSVRTQVQVQEVGRSVLPGGPAAVTVLWSLHLKLWTGEGNTTTSTCRHSRALRRWAAPSRGSRRCGPAFSSLNVVLIILWDTPGTTCIL